MKALEFLIALRYLKAKRQEGFISVIAVFSFIGIMIGVATLIIVMSVMNGFRHELVGRILGVNSHLAVHSYQGAIPNYDSILDEIKKLPAVTKANILVESQAMITANNRNSGALVKAIHVDDLTKKDLISGNLRAGSIMAIEDKNKAILGAVLARSLNLRMGDKFKIIAAKTNSTILGSVPRIKTYEVGGVFASGMYEYDSAALFINLETAQKHFGLKNSVSAIEVFGEDATQINRLDYEISNFLRENHADLYGINWQDANASFIEALAVERNVMFLILTLIILVAAFNIVSSLIMLVGDKKKNIACLRVMGMTKASILRIFLICGSIIGIAGTLLGLVIGVLFSANINAIKEFLEGISGSSLFDPTIYFLSQLPAKIFISDVFLIVGMALFLSFIATLYPAYKASKSDPADILRYE